jgi:hypothetical protein
MPFFFRKPALSLSSWKFLVCFICLNTFFSTSSFSQHEEVLTQLLRALEFQSSYDLEKENRIDSLQSWLDALGEEGTVEMRMHIHLQLAEEYEAYEMQGSFSHLNAYSQLARESRDSQAISNARYKLGNLFVSAGMYKDALDTLEIIRPANLPPADRSLYFGLMGRCYGEMAELSRLSYFERRYHAKATAYREAAFGLTETGTFFHAFLKAFLQAERGERDKAIAELAQIREQFELGLRDQALVEFWLGRLYLQNAEKQKAMFHLALAVICDIQSATKETLAIIELAKLLYEMDKLEMASQLIQKANTDAEKYGARQRKVQVGAVLPLIEQALISRIQKQQSRLYWQNLALSLLLVFILSLTVVVFGQKEKIKKARDTITRSNKRLQEMNQQLIQANESTSRQNRLLQQTNGQLQEANAIKEEYIGSFFLKDADLYDQVIAFKKKVRDYAEQGELDLIKHYLPSINFRKKQEELLYAFDRTFLKLFPHFIQEFNSLFDEGYQFHFQEGEMLSHEIRIFALIRLGINHNEKIARILGLSVNTVYVYKSKVRNRSRVDNKDFDKKLFEATRLKA